ncbi:MAG: dTDP-glucose 4,6-dehydratase, partial [Deltaproteobacteria bacterium]|nr:dTDP-glucose 4,6-dehydratase [Deltaproteobacteria bacterium]
MGANFTRYWMENYPDDRVTVLDALTYAGNRENLAPVKNNPGFYFVHGDIRDYE